MPDYVSGNRFLTESEMHTNAAYIYKYLAPRGWTRNAIAGMIGNMETESTINPAIWQNLDAGNTSLGYGLVQWTPATKYLDWCSARGLTPSSMDSALARIEWELENGEQYYPTDAYPLTFAEFKVSTEAAGTLALAFLANYERPADPSQPARATQAEKWYSYLGTIDAGGVTPDPEPEDPVEPDPEPIPARKRHRMSLPIFLAATRRR
jgi:hypothetical protein